LTIVNLRGDNRNEEHNFRQQLEFRWVRSTNNEAPVERNLHPDNYGLIENNSQRYLEDFGPLFCSVCKSTRHLSQQKMLKKQILPFTILIYNCNTLFLLL
jgi:hypothetical protein